LWSAPPAASVAGSVSTLSSSLATINFVTTSGSVQVVASNSCNAVTASLAVTGQDCMNMLGGSNDGFALGTVVNIPLPIELLSFTAVAGSNQVDLFWTTASELNNDYFTVEKSQDAEVFVTVTTVEGAGTSNQAHQYSAVDKNPFSGVSYYRLKQTDFNGNSMYSKVIAVQFFSDDANAFDIYPNPATAQTFNLAFGSHWEGDPTTLQIIDITGRTLMSVSFICHALVPVSIDRSTFKPGVYLVSVYLNNRRQVRKLVVE